MKVGNAVAALLTAAVTIAAPHSARQSKSSITWGTTKIRGVNIGGWLVLEPWITPSLFEGLDQSLNIVDEFTLCQNLPDQAPNILRQHWESWTCFEDFQKIASAGFNVVRVPIGYWAYDNSGSPYVSGADDYLRKAIDWARTTSPPLKVVIDLHGAPGSQNGYDNSGQRTKTPTWLTDGGVNGPTANQTLCILEAMAQKYACPEYEDVVVAIELLNEPQGWRLNRQDLINFYREGFKRVRSNSGDTVVVLQDAFDRPESWNGVLTPQDGNAQRVALDHHYYQIFSPSEVSLTPQEHLTTVCASASSYWHADKWTFIGEWTGAMTDCARYLNGYGTGARYDGTYPGAQNLESRGVGSCAQKSNIALWDEQMKTDTRMYIEAQMDVFEANTEGWFWWNFKTEGAHEWDMFALVDAGIFPQPLTDRRYAPACSSYS